MEKTRHAMPDIPEDAFTMVGAAYRVHKPTVHKRGRWAKMKGKPVLPLLIFIAIALGCVCSDLLIKHDPADFHLASVNTAPNGEFWFGTDNLGRDIYSVIWQGGRASIFIGLMSAAVIAVMGVSYGCLSGTASAQVDAAMMRAVELLQSIPVLLTLLMLLSLMGPQNPFTLSLVIGMTGWFGLSRIVRSEVRQIRDCEYILASRCMGANLAHIMRRHLIPNFVSAIMFVIISGVSTSMTMESTLSFIGLGLPVDVPSWGSMLALADRALLLNTWWVIVMPGLFLVTTLLCVTSLGHFFRKMSNQGPRHL